MAFQARLRLRKTYGPRDKYHFQSWAISMVDGLPTNKRTADGGIDGRLHFASPNVTSEQSMAIEVKGGRNVSIRDLRALRGVLEADEAWMAGLIILHPPRCSEGTELPALHGTGWESGRFRDDVSTDANADSARDTGR